MSQCNLGYEHEDREPEPVVIPVDSGPNENDVAIAEIEAAAMVKTEQIRAGVAETELESRLGEMEGQIRGMREVLDRLVPPEPEPEPVVVPVPEPEVVPEPAAATPPETEHHSRSAPARKGFFG